MCVPSLRPKRKKHCRKTQARGSTSCFPRPRLDFQLKRRGAKQLFGHEQLICELAARKYPFQQSGAIFTYKHAPTTTSFKQPEREWDLTNRAYGKLAESLRRVTHACSFRTTFRAHTNLQKKACGCKSSFHVSFRRGGFFSPLS